MKIVLEKEKCIGCGTCEALCAQYFEMQEGRSHLKGGRGAGENEEVEVKSEGCVKEAAEACPVGCIRIIQN